NIRERSLSSLDHLTPFVLPSSANAVLTTVNDDCQPTSMRRRRVAESCSGQLVEKEVESGDAAVAGDEEISSGVRGRRAGAARYPFDAAAIAQLLGLGNGLILKVGVSRLDRAGDPVDFVAASKGALTRVIEHAILVPELVEGGAAARWVIFAKYVAQITKQQ